MAVAERPTVRVSNIPQTVTAKELLSFLESKLGPDSVFAVEIISDHKNWKSRGFGRVQFTTLEAKSEAYSLSLQNGLVFKSESLRLSETHDDIIQRPVDPKLRLNGTVLHAGFMVKGDRMSMLESWEGVRAWVMPERKRVEFWVWLRDECYKLEVAFENIMESFGCRLGGEKVNALLLKVTVSSSLSLFWVCRILKEFECDSCCLFLLGFFVYNERKLKSLVIFLLLQDCCFVMVCLRVTGISVIRIIC